MYYDSSAISQSDAKVAGAILEQVGYFNARNSKLDAAFYRKENRYTIAVVVNQTLYSQKRREVDPILMKALKELQDSYANRDYQFQLLAVDSTGIKDETFIQP